jgi:hypothetical protein
LVESLLERQMPALMERRRRLLDALNEHPKPPSTRDILDALIRPQVELLAEHGEPGLRYMRLIHRLQADGDLDQGFVLDRWPGGVDRLVPLLREANPSLPLPVVHLRLGLTIAVMLRSLAQGPAPDRGSLEAHVSAVLDFLTGAFEAPITEKAS